MLCDGFFHNGCPATNIALIFSLYKGDKVL